MLQLLQQGAFKSLRTITSPLSSLTEALSGESVSTAYAVAHLLGALGASPAGNTTQGLQDHIIEELVHALKDSNSQREVLITGERKGTLEDAFYKALLQVTGWSLLES